MVNLKQGLELVEGAKPETIVWLRPVNLRGWEKPFSIKKITEKFDMKAVKVHSIGPLFESYGDEYYGIELVVSGPKIPKDDTELKQWMRM